MTSRSGSITLGEVADRTLVLAVACSRCDRAGQYNLATLIEDYGHALPIPLLLRTLSADCPKRDDQRGINCAKLPALFRTQSKDNAL
jgi:hypothetical protein